MAPPLQTIPDWVPNLINNPHILFITENYPGNPNAIDGNTFFYRSLNQNINVQGNNNLLNNICSALNIPGQHELAKLENFYARNYFLIDTFPHGQIWDQNLLNQTIQNAVWHDIILNDLQFLNPQQIIFTCERSNGVLLPILRDRALQLNMPNIFNALVSPLNTNHNNINPYFGIPITNEVFKSPSDRWIHNQRTNNGRLIFGFKSQIEAVIQLGNLTP
jgi:hypothetical protein